ncbi:MAG TPA: radical SAM protein [Casimicrobiaceae bacterium]|jgi:MoaA/NifB/PqqE/SkfB family radical SAM enzyme|nr:radical SAM protein [Casimicrobiaceae bacterium]
MKGRSVEEYRAPLFIAWQLTNRCGARCITCCEESGPDRAWRDELRRDEALDLARRIAAFGVAYVAFGGGEPLGVPFCWELFELLTRAGVSLKIETDGSRIDDAAADRLAALAVQCVQISVDGATAATHERVRPGSSFAAAIAAIERLSARGCASQFVFVPTRFNIHEIVAAFDLAATLGCGAFVTGPLMRIGRAAADWQRIACSDEDWQRAVSALKERTGATGAGIELSIYPWDIVTEIETRLEHPQAMLLVVPNGKVKLLNALPFAPADLRHESLAQAWQAYRAAWRSTEVREFIAKCHADPGLLRHANETWAMGMQHQQNVLFPDPSWKSP